jgi:hypothetical protein
MPSPQFVAVRWPRAGLGRMPRSSGTAVLRQHRDSLAQNATNRQQAGHADGARRRCDRDLRRPSSRSARARVVQRCRIRRSPSASCRGSLPTGVVAPVADPHQPPSLGASRLVLAEITSGGMGSDGERIPRAPYVGSEATEALLSSGLRARWRGRENVSAGAIRSAAIFALQSGHPVVQRRRGSRNRDAIGSCGRARHAGTQHAVRASPVVVRDHSREGFGSEGCASDCGIILSRQLASNLVPMTRSQIAVRLGTCDIG